MKLKRDLCQLLNRRDFNKWNFGCLTSFFIRWNFWQMFCFGGIFDQWETKSLLYASLVLFFFVLFSSLFPGPEICSQFTWCSSYKRGSKNLCYFSTSEILHYISRPNYVQKTILCIIYTKNTNTNFRTEYDGNLNVTKEVILFIFHILFI